MFLLMKLGSGYMQLETKLYEMQTQVENLTWENKELEERLDMSFRECREIETVFSEMEEELGKVLAKIDLLENELQDLKDEKLQLSELQGKGLWDYRGQYDKAYDKVDPGIPVGTNFGVPSWSSSSCNGSRLTLHDVLMHGDTWYNESNLKPTKQDLLGAEPVRAAPPYHFPSRVALEGFIEEETLRRQRCIALSRSVFSAILSLVVVMIIWEAEDPCMPLVGALFTVVGMSLSSVVQFFSTIKNKPASDAVALLSFNWFILGTLTSPTLPRVTRMLAPPILKFGSRVLGRLGFTS
ncbi:hypothetical protein Taro_035168 [Colocasia esculenta]|uniref:Uncharacterized protein n=1 Tax=Colocasia esculenta TaxID=4460 RepID=A0A843WHT3_COLES|nr:hypothetical protein [Colocasia esculenta]